MSRAEAARLAGMERQALRDAVVRFVEPRGSPNNAEAWPVCTTGHTPALRRGWTRHAGRR